MELEGLVDVITGSGNGFGKAIAERLFKKVHGYAARFEPYRDFTRLLVVSETA